MGLQYTVCQEGHNMKPEQSIEMLPSCFEKGNDSLVLINNSELINSDWLFSNDTVFSGGTVTSRQTNV